MAGSQRGTLGSIAPSGRRGARVRSSSPAGGGDPFTSGPQGSGAGSPRQFFESIFPGSTLSSDQLIAKEGALGQKGVRVIRNSEGVADMIQLPDGSFIVVVAGSGTSGARVWDLAALRTGPDGGGGGGGAGILGKAVQLGATLVGRGGIGIDPRASFSAAQSAARAQRRKSQRGGRQGTVLAGFKSGAPTTKRATLVGG